MFLTNDSAKKDPLWIIVAHIVYEKIRVVAVPVGAEGIMKKMATKGSHIDFMFLAPPLTRPSNFAEDFMTFIVVQDKEHIKQICYKELS